MATSDDIRLASTASESSHFRFSIASLLRLTAIVSVLFAIYNLSAPLGIIFAAITFIIAATPDPAWVRKRGNRISGDCFFVVWLSVFIGPCSPLPYLAWLYLLARARFVGLVLCVVLSPVGLSFFHGISSYYDGGGCIPGGGSHEYRGNLDPTYRVRTSSAWC